MNERRQRIEAAFHAVQECSSVEERERNLTELSATDPGLRRELDALLRSAEAADAVFPRAEAPASVSDAEEQAGANIGQYKLVEKVGEGGMGVVYRAEQQKPVRRPVALKIIKLGMDTRQVIARFEAERQALALMDHPNIARVFDGGATSSGRTYFVMELVDGVPLTEFCLMHQMPLEGRLRLFITVCHAVQHAHQKGIIHRDLKPSNVLVTMQDGVSVPKVIDFGVAKATNQRLTEGTLFTQNTTLIGTPAYMSPEQAEISPGGSVDVDTRSDIYSLGVLLYELLTGTQPFSEKRLRAVSYSEMRRIIAEEEPERPSTRLRRGPADVQSAGVVRRQSSGLDEIDWIVLKCLEKDRTRRYETADGLAADVARYLAHEPIIARPPSAWYEFSKMVRRHRASFIATAAVIVALAAGVIVSTWEARLAREQGELARRERIRAEKEAARAIEERTRAEKSLRATLKLMSKAFDEVVPALNYTIGASKPRHDLTLAGEQIIRELLAGAEPGPEMRQVLGEIYVNLAVGQANYIGTTTGEHAEGLRSAKEAIRLLTPIDSVLTDAQMHFLADAEMWAVFAAKGLMKFDEAFEHLEKMRHWSELLMPSTNALLADRGRQKLQWVKWIAADTVEQMGRTEEALVKYHLPLLAEVQQELKEAPVRPDTRAIVTRIWDLRDSFNSVGRCLLRLGRPQEALPYLRQALPLTEDLMAREPANSAHASMRVESKARLAEALLTLDQPAEALSLFETALGEVDYLKRCDPVNPGFIQLHVTVLQIQASGYLGWASISSASRNERTKRLEESGKSLDQAGALVASLNSQSLRKLLLHDLDRTRTSVAKARKDLNL